MLPPTPVRAQGFGTIKKKITLHRTLPATAHLTATSFAVKVIPRDAKYKDLAQKFTDMLETELLKNDKRLTVDPAHPGTLVACAIESISIPPRQVVTNPNIDIPLKKNRQQQPQQQTYRITGSMTVSFQAKDTNTGRFLDSDNIKARYSEEFDQGGNKVAKGFDALKKPLGVFKKKTSSTGNDDEGAPANVADVQQALMVQAVRQIAARLVNTDETVEVYLARGKLDEANKLAESGRWRENLGKTRDDGAFPPEARRGVPLI